jgi:hypothetical protein
MEVTLEGRDAATNEAPLSADARAVTPNYFRAMSIPLMQGRDFTDQDRDDAPLTLIVSEKFAARYWPGENPSASASSPARIILSARSSASSATCGTSHWKTRGVRPSIFLTATSACPP